MRIANLRSTAPAIGLALIACGEGPPLQEPPVPRASDPLAAAAIAIVSGDGQEGMAGETLAERLVVRVTDADGEGVAGVPVTWSVASGAGFFHVPLKSTRFEGLAWAEFRPTIVGPMAVTARVATLNGYEETTFRIEARGMVITLLDTDDGWGDGVVAFAAPDGSNQAIVPVGTTVEWLIGPSVAGARVTSTSVPPGGAPFDSEWLFTGQRFEFVPRVEGTWAYHDEDTGATGTLTAQ